MRRTLVLAVAVALAFGAGAARADDAADARAIIDKAIQAAGGEANLAKFKAQTWKEKGTYYGMGDGLAYTGKYAVQFPGQFRMEIEGIFTMVLNGDKGWVVEGGTTRDMDKVQFEEQRESLYAGWASTLWPLKDKAFALAPLGEVKVNDRPAAGVKVSHKGHGDVSLYFDKESGLLVKSALRLKASDMGGKEVLHENYFSDYQEVEGVKMPMKVRVDRDGKKFVEAENTEIKPVAKLDDSVFGKP